MCKNIRKAMIDKDLKIKDLAEIMGYSRAHVSQVLNGQVIPSLSFRKHLTLVLERPYKELWPDHSASK